MAGLMNTQKPPPAAAPPGQPPGAPPASGGGDQASYERFVRNGMRLIYSEKTLESVLRSLDGDGNPVEGLANTIASVVTRLTDSAAQKGVDLAPDVVLHGAGELIEQLADLSKESGGHAYTDEEMATVAKAVVDAVGEGGGEQPPPDAAPPAPQRGLAA
jgi:hypothetical protein